MNLEHLFHECSDRLQYCDTTLELFGFKKIHAIILNMEELFHLHSCSKLAYLLVTLTYLNLNLYQN